MEDQHVPAGITLHKQSRTLEIAYADSTTFRLPFEFLRVHSPSAEVRGHGHGQEVLQIGKRNVVITAINAVGNYAIQLHFSDGHNTGIYTWSYLFQLAHEQESLWQRYLGKLIEAGYTENSGRG
jgi:DUF971 family protein